jgi:hypothetical protein
LGHAEPVANVIPALLFHLAREHAAARRPQSTCEPSTFVCIVQLIAAATRFKTSGWKTILTPARILSCGFIRAGGRHSLNATPEGRARQTNMILITSSRYLLEQLRFAHELLHLEASLWRATTRWSAFQIPCAVLRSSAGPFYRPASRVSTQP